MDVTGRAVFLTQLSTGQRIDDVLKIEMQNLRLDKYPPRFYYRIRKINTMAYGFLTDEAKFAITEWLKEREDHIKKLWIRNIKRGITNCELEEALEDKRLFPLERMNVYLIWWKALRKTGITDRDPNTNRRTIHPHSLRKFFKTHCGSVMQSDDIVEALMGHTKGLNAVYNKLQDIEKELANKYIKVQSKLRVFTQEVVDEDVMTRLQDLEQKMESRMKLFGVFNSALARYSTEKGISNQDFLDEYFTYLNDIVATANKYPNKKEELLKGLLPTT